MLIAQLLQNFQVVYFSCLVRYISLLVCILLSFTWISPKIGSDKKLDLIVHKFHISEGEVRCAIVSYSDAVFLKCSLHLKGSFDKIIRFRATSSSLMSNRSVIALLQPYRNKAQLEVLTHS